GREAAGIVRAVGDQDGEPPAVASFGGDVGDPGDGVVERGGAPALPARDRVEEGVAVGGERDLDVPVAAGEGGERELVSRQRPANEVAHHFLALLDLAAGSHAAGEVLQEHQAGRRLGG